MDRKAGSICILFVLVLTVFMFQMLPVRIAYAAEPSLEECLNYEGFTYTGPISTETFPAGTYNVTMYAEWAGYYYQNELYWYPVGGDISPSTLIFTGPQGAQGDMGYVDPPISQTFTSGTQFGLSLKSPDSQSPFYTETSKNSDGQKHAKIYVSTTDPNLYYIGFENMGAASGWTDWDYNDMVVSLQRMPSVGGEWAPINTTQVITPWVTLALLAIALAAAGAAGSHRLLKKRW
jgi:hypothetical protein